MAKLRGRSKFNNVAVTIDHVLIKPNFKCGAVHMYDVKLKRKGLANNKEIWLIKRHGATHGGFKN